MPNRIGPQGTQGQQGQQGAQGATGGSATGTASSLGFMTGSVETSQTVPTPGTWANLTTVGPTVTVNFPSGSNAALVIGYAQVFKDSSYGNIQIGFSATGSVVQSDTSLARCDNFNSFGAGGHYAAFGTAVVTGVNPGNATFTMRYLTANSGWTASKRRLIVIPLTL